MGPGAVGWRSGVGERLRSVLWRGAFGMVGWCQVPVSGRTSVWVVERLERWAVEGCVRLRSVRAFGGRFVCHTFALECPAEVTGGTRRPKMDDF